MPTSKANAGHELYLVLRDFSSRMPQLLSSMHPLSDAPEATLLVGVDALYQRERDLSLLCLRFDESELVPSKQQRLIQLATLAGIPVLDPHRLSLRDRKLFYQQYLRRFAVHIDDQRDTHMALSVLGELLGLIPVSRPVPRAASPRAASPRAASPRAASPRAASPRAPSHLPDSEELLLERAATLAQEDSYLLDPGDDVETRVDPTPGRMLAALVDEANATAATGCASEDIALDDFEDDSDFDEIEDSTHSGDHATATAHASFTLAPEAAADKLDMDLGPAGKVSAPQARGKAKRNERMPTIPARPANARASSPSFDPAMPAARLAMPPLAVRARMSSPPPIAIDPGDSDQNVRVRFQRGDSWMPARLRNLTTKEIRLAASAAPALGHHLKVSVNVGEYGVMLHGTVVEVVNTERSVDGSTTFRLEFQELSARERDQLVSLLRMAQRQGISLTPPPPRKNRRFAISWPVAVVSEGHRFNAAALDISERGLFLATNNFIQASRLVFGIPLDRPQEQVQGRARVARQVTSEMAERLGLQTGYGLQIEGLKSDDEGRFTQFLLRVRKRSEKHIIVVGEGERSQHLAECFHAAGYAVSRTNNVEKMLLRNHIDLGGPNMAVLDQGSLSAQLRDDFIASFAEHQIPVLRLDGQSPHIARNALDQALYV